MNGETWLWLGVIVSLGWSGDWLTDWLDTEREDRRKKIPIRYVIVGNKQREEECHLIVIAENMQFMGLFSVVMFLFFHSSTIQQQNYDGWANVIRWS